MPITLSSAGNMAEILNTFLRIKGNNSGGSNSGSGAFPPAKSVIALLIEIAVRLWEESGKSYKNQSELLETMFSAPNLVGKKLSKKEQKKAAAVIEEMTAPEQLVFSIAMMILNPEVVTIKVPAVKDGAKVVTPASERTEKNGVDHRINIMRGIASHVNDDLSNAKEVADMLRGLGAISKNEKSFKLFGKIQTWVKSILCYACGVTSLNDITLGVLKARGVKLINLVEMPDPTQPLPGYEPSRLMRKFAWLPGMPPMPPESARTETTRRTVPWWVLGMIAVVIITAIFEGCDYRTTETTSGSVVSELHLVNIPASADSSADAGKMEK
ncbi:MAG: hypothetical protein UY04_C0012G0023 [Parcubacteria group bacterium GW2011_GWA2_47_7]|nr:MAG: hypothetical protein UY04_C0012G0023 [Parcubacteria group bacterium GW2011_GWA2_47_7]